MSDDIAARCRAACESAAETHRRAGAALAPEVVRVVTRLNEALASGRKVIVCGNGGSAAESQHFAAELTGRFRRERQALPALALTVDTSALTAIGNDAGYEQIFSRQLEALARPGDLFVGFSTSGGSKNVLRAMQAAQDLGLTRAALVGERGGPIADLADVAVKVPSRDTPRIQESHLLVVHLFCAAIEAAC